MHITIHASQRMNHRGITKEMIIVVLEYGEPQDETVTLSRDAAARLITELQTQAERLQHHIKDAATRQIAELRGQKEKLQRRMRVTKKILDKGGVTVVIVNNTLVTVWNCVPSRKRKRCLEERIQCRETNPMERAFGLQRRKLYGQ